MRHAVLIDSNIVIYAINRASPKHMPAQAFLQQNSSRLVLAHQNIFESLRVLTHGKFAHPMAPAAALQAVESIAKHCTIIAPDAKALHIAEALVQKHGLAGDKIFDAYLAATALAAGVSTIATDNTKDFACFEGLKVINPFH